ncbi:CidA/LrgA family protein [Cohnella terricola]|uniref:Holin n=1 Tax=Cohnella terricola TaxID=1289167 RepID=A0A559JKV7_9BACL|nr:CidA/LrgA family protein [Cohnella terricola]TVY00512.1 holin [Cohnella terricola]
MKKIMIAFAQVLFFVLLAKGSDVVVQYAHLPVPGSLLGIAILFALLRAKAIKPNWVDLGSKWLLAEMLLFFIPATIRIIDYKKLVLSSGIQIMGTIVLSTLIVMACAGLVSQKLASRGAKGAD